MTSIPELENGLGQNLSSEERCPNGCFLIRKRPLGAVAKFRYFSGEHDGDLGMDLAESLVSDFERLAEEAQS